jgi:hypothetical protein
MYHSKCIEHLVSVSDDLEAVYDENLLVASVILRFYEEVDGMLYPFELKDVTDILQLL